MVLLSAYNGEKYIQRQIESIMLQKTNANVNLLVRDDGSSDNTTSVIIELQKKYPNRIELIKGKNIGVNASFFELLKNAGNCDYYAISDQDDVWLSNKIETGLQALNEKKIDEPLLYASTSFVVDERLEKQGLTRALDRPLTIYNTVVQNICPGHNMLFNTALKEKIIENYNSDYIYVYDSWIANTAMLYGKIIFDNEPHTLYRQHEKNEFGYGDTKLKKLIRSTQHVLQGDGNRNRKQLEYFCRVNKKALQEKGYLHDLEALLNANNLFKRIAYLSKGKVYRQSKIETLALYCGILIGKI